MKKFIFLLVIFSPVFAFTQNATERILNKDYFFQYQGLNNPEKFIKSIELLQWDIFSKPFSKEITKTKLNENSGYENFTSHELILRIKEKILKSANQDTLLMDSLYKYTFKTPTDSTLTEKLLYSYNSFVNQCIITKSNWDTVTQKWYFTSKEEYFYDQNGNDTLMILYKTNVDNKWAFNQKYVTTYNQKNNITSRAFYLWHNLTQKWWGQNKQIYEFDESGNKTLEAFYTWSDVRNKWQGSSKSEYGYDEHGLKVLLITYQWDQKLFDWVGTVKEEYTYNKQGIQVSEIYAEWNTDLKDWRYVNKTESEELNTEDGMYYYFTYYQWDIILNRWKGLDKIEYFFGETEQVVILYNWNIMEEKWEAATKSVVEIIEPELRYKYNTFKAKDSIITGEIINGFNSESEFSNIWITPACPDQTCTALDSDRVEGNASILWNYNINGNLYATGGFCQVQMNTDKDMSQYSGLSINCKVLTPSPASFILRLTETSGEVWMIENTYTLADSSVLWQQIVFPFSEMTGTGTFIDGIFDNRNIKNIQLRLNVPKGIKTSGSVLIDNLIMCNISKTDEWLLNAFVDVLYDEHGNTISEISKRWDAGLQQFVEDSKYKAEFKYNEFGLVTNFEAFVWEEPMEDWSNYRKEENDYDENGNKTRSESYFWNLDQNKWIGNSKFEQSFNEYGYILNSINYQWDNLTDSWLNAAKTGNTYTESGKLTSNSNYSWNNSLQKWIGESKHDTVYNALDEEIKTIEYAWDSKNNEWKVSAINLAGYYNDLYNTEGKITAHVFVAWNETLNEWCAAEKYYYFYSTHNIILTGLPDAATINQFVEIYPNPATDLIYLRLLSDEISGTANLYNNNGQLLKKIKLISNLNTVQVNELPKGLYILRIETNRLTESKKVLIQ
jgi:hypothetical protein